MSIPVTSSTRFTLSLSSGVGSNTSSFFFSFSNSKLSFCFLVGLLKFSLGVGIGAVSLTGGFVNSFQKGNLRFAC